MNQATPEDKRPLHSTTVETYAELRDDFRAFAEGKYNFLTVLGSGGLGKSETAKQVMEDQNPLVIETKVSAFELYCMLFEHRDAPVILDDVPDIHKNPDIVAKLKSLTDTRRIKTIQHNTKAPEQAGLPSSFQTTSRLLLIANEWATLNANVRALEQRGVTFIFEPSPSEVHREVAAGGWFHDYVVYDFIFEHLHLIRVPSFRLYIQASLQRKAKRPWKKRLLEWMIGDSRLRQVAQVMADPKYKTENQRAKAFSSISGMSERTYWRLKKERFRRYDAPKELDENPGLPMSEEQQKDFEETFDQLVKETGGWEALLKVVPDSLKHPPR